MPYSNVNPYGHPSAGAQFAQAENERHVAEQQARIEAAKKSQSAQEQGQHVPGSGVMNTNSLSRPPAWEGKITPRGIDPYAAAQQPPANPLPAPTNDVLAGGRSQAERNIMANPNDWRGKSGIGAAAPRMDPGWQLKGTAGEGVTIPDSARNYKGEKSYVDPYTGPTIDVDPSKDQRFSVNGQTSGAQTAAGIAAKYQVPGATASFTPGTVTDSTGNTMAQNGQVTPPVALHPSGFDSAQSAAAARTASLKAHPEIGKAGTAANQAFVAHAQQFGEPSAHANVASIVAGGPELNPTATNAATSIPNSAPATENIATNSARQGAGGGPKLQPY